MKWLLKNVKGLLVVPLLFLVACETYDETRFAQHRSQVHSEPVSIEIPVGQLTDGYLDSIASDFKTNGVGFAQVVVGYEGNAMGAAKDLSRITSAFDSHHAVNVDSSILPIKDTGNVNQVLISYIRSYAKAPDDCTMMPHVYNGDTRTLDKDYQFGCQTEMLMARQVARPSDLAGKEDTMGLNNGSRLGNKTAAYAQGVALGDLGGQTTQ